MVSPHRRSPRSSRQPQGKLPLKPVDLHPYAQVGLWFMCVALPLSLGYLSTPIPNPGPLWSLVLGSLLYGCLWSARSSLQRWFGPLNLRLLELVTIVLLGSVLALLLAELIPRDLLGGTIILSLGFPLLLTAVPALGDRLRHRWTKPLGFTRLTHQSSEAKTLIQKRIPTARFTSPLSVLPTRAPILVSYGLRPQDQRIWISEGLLESLTGAELASLYAWELGHARDKSAWVLPSLVLLLQLPYGLYWALGYLGDLCLRQHRDLAATSDPPKRSPQTLALLQGLWLGLGHILGIGAALAYGLFKLGRWCLLPLARQRAYYGDRAAPELLGDPNPLSQALLKLAAMQNQDLQTRTMTHPLLESLELLLPLGLSHSQTLSLYNQVPPTADPIPWESQSPHRHWLSLNSPHPSLGDRLAYLAQYAHHWGIPPHLTLNRQPALPLCPLGSEPQPPRPLTQSWFPLALQALPYLGPGLGLLLALSIWFLSALANLIGLWPVTWLFGNTNILVPCLPLGFSLGILLRNNRFFPNVPNPLRDLTQILGSHLTDPQALPLRSPAIRGQGTLIGRQGVRNWLGQDLWLLTPQGLIRLHHSGWCGVGAALWPGTPRLERWLGQSVVVQGWLRRGQTLWIDTIAVENVQGFRIAGYPGLSLFILAIAFSLWACILWLTATL